jgi:hypothetical protein
MTDTKESEIVDDAPTIPDHEAAPTPSEPARSESPPSEPADLAPPVAGLIEAIRAGLAPGASPELRAASATACRSVLTVLEAKPGQPLTAAPLPPASPAPPASAASPIAALLKQPGVLAKLAAMSRDELINLVKQTVAAMGKSPQAEQPTGARFHLIQIPQPRRPDGQ